MMKDKFLNWLNLVLVADVFLVLFGFGWLAIAATGKSFGLNLGLDLWHQLWQPLFNPAIGILMAGALLSSLISWISRKFSQNSQ
jgi:TRAP-type C4-dicarboxylate transport system permease small subunit